jgi:peptide/nickel transport system permease protein
MLSAGRDYIREYPHLVLFPGVFIMMTVLAFNVVGDALRDFLDPKLKD